MASAPETALGITIAFSFTLFGNAITQSLMSVPALLIDFPGPSSADHAAAARRLGRQWPVFFAVGNMFFRPISTLGVAGYAYAAWAAYAGASSSSSFSSSSSSSSSSWIGQADWRPLAVAAGCHLVTVVHSAVNLQPLNERIMALGGEEGKEELKGGNAQGDGDGAKADVARAEDMARRWAKLNLLRMVMPLVAGSLALWEVLKAR